MPALLCVQPGWQAVATGELHPTIRPEPSGLLEIAPADASGIWGIKHLTITPSGNAYAYTVVRKFSDLYLIEGPREPQPAGAREGNDSMKRQVSARRWRYPIRSGMTSTRPGSGS
ncbi:MAG: hypothetical protein ACM3NQ_06185 [Bacteroidales bacterium]